MYDVCKQLPTNVNIGNLTNLVGKITIEVFVKAFRSFSMQIEDAVNISYFLDLRLRSTLLCHFEIFFVLLTYLWYVGTYNVGMSFFILISLLKASWDSL